MYFDHGLHTPDYVVIPPVQSNGNQSVSKGVESTPDVVYIPRSMLRITYLSYVKPTLTLQITAPTSATLNYLVIRVDGQNWTTPALFFGRNQLGAGDMREVSLTAYPNGKGVVLTRMLYVDIVNGKAYKRAEKTAWRAYGGLAIAEFDITDFTVQLRNYASETDRDSVTENDFDADGNRIGTVASAPSQRKPKLTTMWATLKRGN